VETPLGFTVRCTPGYWAFIASEKHPVLSGREKEIQQILRAPSEIRRSKNDSTVVLFYGIAQAQWLCAVVKKENGTGFLITAYPTDIIKAGEPIWTRSK
jgi:hypothetical protein